MDSSLEPTYLAADEFEIENTSALTPAFSPPEILEQPALMINQDFSNVTDVAQEENALTLVDRVESFTDDYLQSKVTAVQSVLQEQRVQEGLKTVGLEIKAEDLTYSRAKLAMAFFGAYKLLSHPAIGKFSLPIGIAIAYFAFNHNKMAKEKVAKLSQGVDSETKEKLGSFGSVCNRRTGSFK